MNTRSKIAAIVLSATFILAGTGTALAAATTDTQAGYKWTVSEAQRPR